jgi:ABC-type multidrug transport system ATPase subunit
MTILLNNISKRYNRQWIFKNLNYKFESGHSYSILGNNGSGKSTLLQCIIGAVTTSEGNIAYLQNEKPLVSDKVHEHIALATPYLELIEEFTTIEMIEFHAKFKPLYDDVNLDYILNAVDLQNAKHKQIVNFSSGMKQRLKLALAFFSKSSVLCLDEPTANLDINGVNIYLQLVENFTFNRTVIVASNDEKEYHFCKHHIKIDDYKQ